MKHEKNVNTKMHNNYPIMSVSKINNFILFTKSELRGDVIKKVNSLSSMKKFISLHER